METGHQLVFGAFRVDPVRQQLWRGEELVELQPKPLAVLQFLVERPGRVVTKEERLEEIWAGTYVTKAALKICIQAIRRALGEEAATPHYIDTVGREGYRFLGDGQGRIPESASEETILDTPVIVGREAELDQLHRWLRTALDGQRQCVFVTGESGIGKTAIVDLFQRQVRALGRVSIGHGQCVEQYGEGEAYLPVLEAMGRLCREAGGSQLVTLARRYAPTWLVQLPGLTDEADRASLQAQTQDTTQRRMLREMAELVEQATTRRPLLLVLEDLQWSDPSTLELLGQENQKAKSKKQRAKVKEAEQCFRKASAVSRYQHPKSWELRAATSLARLWQRQGKPAEAHELLGPVYSWFTEGFETPDLQEAKAVLEA